MGACLLTSSSRLPNRTSSNCGDGIASATPTRAAKAPKTAIELDLTVITLNRKLQLADPILADTSYMVRNGWGRRGKFGSANRQLGSRSISPRASLPTDLLGCTLIANRLFPPFQCECLVGRDGDSWKRSRAGGRQNAMGIRATFPSISLCFMFDFIKNRKQPIPKPN